MHIGRSQEHIMCSIFPSILPIFVPTWTIYYAQLILHETIRYTYNYTKLLGLWKKKSSELDMNMMRCIHRKDWDAKLSETLITERMKALINEAIPKIQIGGKAGHASVDHLVFLKTYIKALEAK